MPRHRNPGGFTLVELLVVIAIIAILIALLIGPIMRARRGAMVLACPVATRAANDSSVLVHPRGSAELAVAPPSELHEPCGPEWSTNGTWIGYTATFGKGSSQQNFIAIVHAMTGKTKVYGDPYRSGPDGTFAGWADDGHFISIGRSGELPAFVIREASTGRVSETYASEFLSPMLGWVDIMVRRVPPSTGAQYITTIYSNRNAPGEVVLLRKDFSIKRVIYKAQTILNPVNSVSPASIDPLGEFVAFTNNSGVAVKALKSPSTELPNVILPPAGPFSSNLFFCDWTEDGNILAATHSWRSFTSGTSSWSELVSERLVILSRTGKMLGTVREEKIPYFPYASWRKYMHQ